MYKLLWYLCSYAVKIRINEEEYIFRLVLSSFGNAINMYLFYRISHALRWNIIFIFFFIQWVVWGFFSLSPSLGEGINTHNEFDKKFLYQRISWEILFITYFTTFFVTPHVFYKIIHVIVSCTFTHLLQDVNNVTHEKEVP